MKMKYIQEHDFQLPKEAGKKTASESGGRAKTEEERLLTFLYHYLSEARKRGAGKESKED